MPVLHRLRKPEAKRVIVEGLAMLSRPSLRPQNEDDDSWTTILSEEDYGWEENHGDDDSQPGLDVDDHQKLSDEDRWNWLQSHFRERKSMLRRLSKGRNKAFFRMMLEHERQVRKEEEQRLLATIDKKPNDFRPKDQDNSFDTRSVWWQIRNAALFEYHSSLPAACSLTVFNLAHIAVYYAIASVLHKAKKIVGADQFPAREDTFMLAAFLIGCGLLRMSGYLYWWLGSSDYACLKFDLHNRLRLGHWEPRLLAWIKCYPLVRAWLFLVGYYLAYFAAVQLHFRLTQLFDQREELLKGLPSKQYDLDVCVGDLALEAPGSPASFSCQAEMERLEAQHEELRTADLWYTWGVMSAESYEYYWSEIGQGSEESSSLISPWFMFGLNVGIGALSILALHTYGFFFFERY